MSVLAEKLRETKDEIESLKRLVSDINERIDGLEGMVSYIASCATGDDWRPCLEFTKRTKLF